MDNPEKLEIMDTKHRTKTIKTKQLKKHDIEKTKQTIYEVNPGGLEC
jgi:hypothetical protein